MSVSFKCSKTTPIEISQKIILHQNFENADWVKANIVLKS